MINSSWTTGSAVSKSGVAVDVYPEPGLVIEIELIVPPAETVVDAIARTWSWYKPKSNVLTSVLVFAGDLLSSIESVPTPITVNVLLWFPVIHQMLY